MKGHALISLVSLLLLSLTSCSDIRSTNDNAKSTAIANSATRNSNDRLQGTNDNVEDLRGLIRVPFDPEEVVWQVFSTASNGQRLIAVFHLMPDDARTFRNRIESTGSASPVQVNIEQWYPAELVTMSETNGEAGVVGTAYPASEFTQQPYNLGSVILIPETDFVILELSEK